MTRLLGSANASETALPHHHFQYHALPGFQNTETISRSTFRLSYLVGERVRKNWARSNYKEGLVHHLTEEARVGGSTEHLVLLENTRIRAWRTDQSWIQLITSRHQRLNLFDQICQFSVSRSDNWGAGLCQYEWTTLCRPSIRSLFLGCFMMPRLLITFHKNQPSSKAFVDQGHRHTLFYLWCRYIGLSAIASKCKCTNSHY